jgi:hypothetical protein
VEQLKDSRTQFVPKKDNTRILPRCFHRTLRGITAIASERRLVKDKEIKWMMDEVDKKEEKEEEDKIKVLKDSMRYNNK